MSNLTDKINNIFQTKYTRRAAFSPENQVIDSIRQDVIAIVEKLEADVEKYENLWREALGR